MMTFFTFFSIFSIHVYDFLDVVVSTFLDVVEAYYTLYRSS